MCAGDILRLAAHDADIACGVDFVANTFWDKWVTAYGGNKDGSDTLRRGVMRRAGWCNTAAKRYTERVRVRVRGVRGAGGGLLVLNGRRGK